MNETAKIKQATSEVTLRDRWINVMAHLGINRNKCTFDPGLYALGSPDQDSPVFVTANYSPSFRALRTALKGIHGYVLVLDTKGINVWCAAGKGTFGTDELVLRIEQANLGEIIKHRRLILPQLGAAGVAAHEVKKRSGFKVDYGPVRAADLPQYLATGEATAEMRRVRFPLKQRLEIVPVEIVNTLILAVALGLPLYFAGGILASLAALAAIFAGNVLFPPLLPWLPTSNFSTKGFFLGALVALPFAVMAGLGYHGAATWQRAGWALAHLLFMPPLTAFLALNYTGSTTFTSWSGVKREIFAYVPVMAWMFAPGLLLMAALSVAHAIGA
ncbi:MAG: mercury methylation corrinoid protein HgcA [Planctomycetota bacterium]